MGGKAGSGKALTRWGLREQLPTNPLDWWNAGVSYNHIEVSVIRGINWTLRALDNDEIHQSHGCDTPFLGQLMALVVLSEPMRKSRVATKQLEEWRTIYTAWFERRRFRSAKAKLHRETVFLLMDDLLPRASGAPRDFWVNEAWPNGHPPEKERGAPEAKKRKDTPTLVPSYIDYQDGWHGLFVETGEDTGYLWQAMVDYVARKNALSGFETVTFDPDSGSLAVRCSDKGTLAAVEDIIARLRDDPSLRAEAMASAGAADGK